MVGALAERPCPLCGGELSGWAEVGNAEGVQPTFVSDCARCGRLRLDPAAQAVLGLAEPEEVAAVAAYVASLRAEGEQAALALRPEVFIDAGL